MRAFFLSEWNWNQSYFLATNFSRHLWRDVCRVARHLSRNRNHLKTNEFVTPLLVFLEFHDFRTQWWRQVRAAAAPPPLPRWKHLGYSSEDILVLFGRNLAKWRWRIAFFVKLRPSVGRFLTRPLLGFWRIPTWRHCLHKLPLTIIQTSWQQSPWVNPVCGTPTVLINSISQVKALATWSTVYGHSKRNNMALHSLQL